MKFDVLTSNECESIQRHLDETISRDFLEAADFAASLDEYRCIDHFSVRWDFEAFSVDSRSVSVYLNRMRQQGVDSSQYKQLATASSDGGHNVDGHPHAGRYLRSETC